LFSRLLADGSYLCAWPIVAAAAPPVALLVGLLAGWLHPLGGATYTSSILVMAVLLVVGGLGSGLGSWLLAGYVLGDLLYPHPFSYRSLLWGLLHVRAPLLIAYLLLAVMVVLVPAVGQGAGRSLAAHLRSTGRGVRIVAAAVLQGTLQGALAWVWTHSVPTLIRPVYTWSGATPPTSAIQPLQERGLVLVVIAAALGVARPFLAAAAARRSPGAAAAPLPLPRRRRASWPAWISITARVLVTAFVLAGIFTGWLDALGFAAAFVGLLLFRRWLARVEGWARLIVKVPILLRIGLGVGSAYLLGHWIVGTLWSRTSTFLPILASTTLSLLVLAALLPEGASGRPTVPRATSASR
jgi:hypothetical protein